MATAGQKYWTEWVQEYIDGCDNLDFQAYRGNKSASDERSVWLTKHIADLGHMENGRVLDIGCGFGWNAVAISLLASAVVVANDIRPEMTSVVAKRVDEIRKSGAPVNVETLTGDICSIALPDKSFDAIVCQQTLEHVHDLEALFKVCFRLLKPGGRAIFTNDNNILNRAVFLAIQNMWNRRDSDWGFIEELKKVRPIENRDIQPYAVMRRDIVRRANPSLNAATVTKIVDATAGLTASEIEPIARSYVPGKELPVPPHSSWCRNPITGEYCERQLDPYEIAGRLDALGFKAQVRHGFRRWPLSWLNHIQLRWLNDRLFNRRAFFIIAATKPAH